MKAKLENNSTKGFLEIHVIQREVGIIIFEKYFLHDLFYLKFLNDTSNTT